MHKVGIKSSSLDKVYQALTTREGLSAWWTNDSQGEGKVGGVLKFRFDGGGFDMKVLELQSGKRVLWQVIEGPEEWVGTRISFDLKQEGEWTIILFKHEGWKEPVEFMHHCSTKWAVFLLSLKSLLKPARVPPSKRSQDRQLGMKPRLILLAGTTTDESAAPVCPVGR